MGWAAGGDRVPVVHPQKHCQCCAGMGKWECQVTAAGGQEEESEGQATATSGTTGDLPDAVPRRSPESREVATK